MSNLGSEKILTLNLAFDKCTNNAYKEYMELICDTMNLDRNVVLFKDYIDTIINNPKEWFNVFPKCLKSDSGFRKPYTCINNLLKAHQDVIGKEFCNNALKVIKDNWVKYYKTILRSREGIPAQQEFKDDGTSSSINYEDENETVHTDEDVIDSDVKEGVIDDCNEEIDEKISTNEGENRKTIYTHVKGRFVFVDRRDGLIRKLEEDKGGLQKEMVKLKEFNQTLEIKNEDLKNTVEKVYDFNKALQKELIELKINNKQNEDLIQSLRLNNEELKSIAKHILTMVENRGIWQFVFDKLIDKL